VGFVVGGIITADGVVETELTVTAKVSVLLKIFE
jgi:hypothetical protein